MQLTFVLGQVLESLARDREHRQDVGGECVANLLQSQMFRQLQIERARRASSLSSWISSLASCVAALFTTISMRLNACCQTNEPIFSSAQTFMTPLTSSAHSEGSRRSPGISRQL